MFTAKIYLAGHIKKIHPQTFKKVTGYKREKEQTWYRQNLQIECKLCLQECETVSLYIQHYEEIHGMIPPEYNKKELFKCEKCPGIFVAKVINLLRGIDGHMIIWSGAAQIYIHREFQKITI